MTPLRIVVMGVSGCGKSSVGQGIATALGMTFTDGDDLHPPTNVAKMSAGQPLTDEDRWPWLATVGETLRHGGVVACSALKRTYRDQIRSAAPATVFLHLHGSRELLAARLAARPGHFMPPALLDSQLAALEPPTDETGCFTFDIAATVPQIIALALAELKGFSKPENEKA